MRSFLRSLPPFFALSLALTLCSAACSSVAGTRTKDDNGAGEGTSTPVCRFVFDADSAYSYCAQQCAFGPRTMNSPAHDACAEWIKGQFAARGLTVSTQRTTVNGYDGTPLKIQNIIASLHPSATKRLLLCAHWDSRPWADNDASADNQHLPILAANDGASGVAVLLEIARLLTTDSVGVAIGVDFVCFDAEDYGIPQWEDSSKDPGDTWALGAQHWAKTVSAADEDVSRRYLFGILLDMVGGADARFYKEGLSQHYAPDVVQKVWKAAKKAGYGHLFPSSAGTYVTDDHVYVNEIAGIKCIDIIPYVPSCPQSTFGATWHTVDDTMDHISVATLRAVGQTVAAVLAAY